MMSKDQVGIVTISKSANYGAALQCYALQNYINKYSHAEVINYSNPHVNQSTTLIRVELSLRGVLKLIKDIIRLPYRYKVLRRFLEFRMQEIKESREYNSAELKSCQLPYRILLSGSDQIWNPLCVNASGEIDDIYFLNFGREEARRISYASSMGFFEPDDTQAEVIRSYLLKFSDISMREASSAKLLSRKTGLPIDVVLDPSFLLPRNEWCTLSRKAGLNISEKKYVFAYFLHSNAHTRSVVKEIKDKLNFPVVCVTNEPLLRSGADKYIRDAGPYEFLALIRDCEFVITNSFHGCVFSIIFNKKFVAVSPGKSVNRIESLMSLCQGESNIVYPPGNVAWEQLKSGQELYSKLLPEIERSKLFVAKAIL